MSRYLAVTARYREVPEAGPLNEDQLTQTVRNLLALTEEQREEYRRELDLASPDDPWLHHDREALRRAQAILGEMEGSHAA